MFREGDYENSRADRAVKPPRPRNQESQDQPDQWALVVFWVRMKPKRRHTPPQQEQSRDRRIIDGARSDDPAERAARGMQKEPETCYLNWIELKSACCLEHCP